MMKIKPFGSRTNSFFRAVPKRLQASRGLSFLPTYPTLSKAPLQKPFDLLTPSGYPYNLLKRRCFSSSTQFESSSKSQSKPKKKFPWLRAFILFDLGVAALTAAFGYYLISSNEGFHRSFTFWRKCLPIFFHYKLVEYLTKNDSDEEQDRRYNELHEMYSDEIKNLVLELQGFYTKLAQVTSTRDEFIPEQYMRWCKQMQDQIPSPLFTSQQAQQVVEDELGVHCNEFFVEWDDEPVGSASIGQVYRARLRDSGEEVAVKIQYPDIEHKFRADIQTIKTFCELFMPQHVTYLDEIERQFLTEFDYRGEAANLEEIGDNLRNSPWKKEVVVPRPLMNFCTKDVLVMEYLDGKKLVDGVKDHYEGVAALMGRSVEELIEEQKALIQAGKLKKQTLRQASRDAKYHATLIKVSNFFFNSFAVVYNFTFGLITRSQLQLRTTQAPLDLGDILYKLLAVHGYEMLVDGAFNGDPHPGNVLLLKNGKLGLIDYGQVKRWSKVEKVAYSKLIVALYEDNREEIVRVMTNELGLRTKHMNEDVIYRLAAFWNDRDTSDITEGLNVHLFMEQMEAKDPVLEVAEDYIMASRVSFLLRGMANAFNLSVRTSEAWYDTAKKVLESQ